MPLSLGDTQVLNQIADILYPFLPGNPHPYADATVSFRGIAKDLKLGRFWIDGSKLGSISHLLAKTYEADKGRFATLVREVVRRGLTYREAKDPVVREELDTLNELLLKLSFRVKDLTDPKFLESLPTRRRRSAAAQAPSPSAAPPPPPVTPDLIPLKRTLGELAQLEPQPRGYAFERFLNDLFGGFGLAPRGAFWASRRTD